MMPEGFVSERRAAELLTIKRSTLQWRRVHGHVPTRFFFIDSRSLTRERVAYRADILQELAVDLGLHVGVRIEVLAAEPETLPIRLSAECAEGDCEHCAGCGDACHDGRPQLSSERDNGANSGAEPEAGAAASAVTDHEIEEAVPIVADWSAHA